MFATLRTTLRALTQQESLDGSETPRESLPQPALNRTLDISARQFGQRLVPNHLENTSIDSQYAIKSICYWIDVIDLFLANEGEFLATGITQAHLEQLHNILNDYARMKKAIASTNSVEERKETAEKILSEVKDKLSKPRGFTYVPHGYVAGPYNSGHAIPAKFCTYQDKVEVLFLNLGEGLQMHPQLFWGQTEIYFHFQSFPIHLDPKTLYGKEGVNLLSRQIRLQNEVPRISDAPLSAEDCYAPYWDLGTVQSAFNSKLADRADPKQKGPTCADMGTVLLITDFLIEAGYSRKEISRFMLNEKCCALMSFQAQLDREGDYDAWSLLRKGIEQYAIELAQAYEDEDREQQIDERELNCLGRACEEMAKWSDRRLEELKPQESQLPPLVTDTLTFPKIIELQGVWNTSPSSSLHPATHIPPSFPIALPNPAELVETVTEWQKTVSSLAKLHPERASHLLCQLLFILPIPTLDQASYWDELPEKHIEEVLSLLANLVSEGLKWDDKGGDYQRIAAAHTAYAIADKLARRLPEMHLEGFASPWFLADFQREQRNGITQALWGAAEKKKESYFAYDILPLGPVNAQWSEICRYFESQVVSSQETLFAIKECSADLVEGAKVLQKTCFGSQRPTPVSTHMNYLKQFLPEASRIRSEEELARQLGELWVNEDGKKLPHAYEPFYFLAYYAHNSLWRKLTAEAAHGPFVQRELRYRGFQLFVELPKIPYRHPTHLSGVRTIRPITTNQALCTLEPHQNIGSLQQTREWLRIFSQSETRISSLTQWLNQNRTKLNLRSFELIEQALFEPGFLHKKLEEEPQAFHQLRASIKEGVELYLRESDFEKTLAFARIAILLESFSCPPHLDTLAELEEKLLLLKEECGHEKIYPLLLLIYRIALPNDAQSARHMVIGQLYMHYLAPTKDTYPDWLHAEISHITNLRQKELSEYYQNPSWRKEVAEEAHKFLIPNSLHPSTPSSQERYPKIRWNLFTLDIENGTVKRFGNQTLMRFPDHLHFDELSWGHEGRLLSLDGQAMLKCEEDGRYEFQILKQIDKVPSQWFTRGKLSTNFKIPLFAGKEAWASFDSHPFQLIVEDRYLARTHPDNFWEIHQFKGNKTTGLLLANQEAPFTPFFSRLQMEKEVCCWVDPSSHTVQEIEFPKIELSFVLEAEKGYICTQFAEYGLAEAQSLDLLNHYSGTLVLSNGSKRALILPAKELSSSADDFSTQAIPKESYFSDQVPYFFFRVDPYAEVLVSENPAANLYLTLLFATQRDYEKAQLYLARAHTYKNTANCEAHTFHGKLLKAFRSLGDHSPEALAFFLHLTLYYLENSSQLIADHYGLENDHHRFIKELGVWAGEIYAEYIPILSSYKVSAIPGAARLTYEQEKLLLSKLEPILSEMDRKASRERLSQTGHSENSYEGQLALSTLGLNWVPELATRYRLLHEGSIEKRVPTRHFPARLWGHFILPLHNIEKLEQDAPRFEWNEEKELPDFVRLSLWEIQTHFVTLYEQARAQNSLDTTFILRSSGSDPAVYFSYAALLRHISFYPDSFKDLDFGKDPDKNRAIFQEVVKRANSTLNLPYRQVEAVTNYFRGAISFGYTNKKRLKLPASPHFTPMKWSLTEDESAQLKHFFEEVYNAFFQFDFRVEKIARLDPDTPSPFASFKPVSETEKALIKEFERGRKLLTDPRHGEFHYALCGEQTLEDCRQKALELADAKRRELLELKEEVERKANTLPREATLLSVRKIGKDLPAITIEGVLTEAYEKQNPRLIQEANPSLSKAKVHTLLLKTVRYHLLRIQIFQLEKAASAKNLQAFGEALALHPSLPAAYEPEIYLYQSRTGTILWKKQVELLEWYMTKGYEADRTLFALPAGGGKTTVLQPILLKWLQRKGHFPGSISPKPLYLVDREGLRAVSQHVYDLNVAVFELALSTKSQASDYKWLYEKLTQYRGEKGLKLTPEVLSALLLKEELALDCRDEESVYWLGQITHLLKHEMVDLFDEARSTCSPLTQAEIGIGKPRSLPLVDRKTFIEIYRVLANPELDALVGLTRNQQAMLNPDQYADVRKRACRILVKNPYFKLDRSIQKAISDYWEGKTPRFEWKSHDQDQERAVELVKIYFEIFFPSAMKCVGNMQHLPSLQQGEEIHVPARKKQASDAYFKEVYATLITTIQGTLQRGLNSLQTLNLLKEMRREHRNENLADGSLSKIEQELQKWTGDEQIQLADFSPSKPKSIKNFKKLIGRNLDAILFYLERSVLQQVAYCPEQLVASPIHSLEALQKSILFSADPGAKEIYGILGEKENVYTDPSFVAHVIHQLAKPENSEGIIYESFHTPFDLLGVLLNTDRLRMIIDVGGMLRDFSSKEIKEDFFRLLEENKEITYDGLILFEDSQDANQSNRQVLYLKERSIELTGNDIVEALAAHGMEWETLRLLTYIDPSHTTGANIKQQEDARALLLLGEGLALSDLVQGVMRLREFLEGQSIYKWVVSSSLKENIQTTTGKALDAASYLEWTFKNEAKRVEEELSLSAQHQLIHTIEREARSSLDRTYNNPKKRIEIWHRHRKGFVTEYEWDPLKRFPKLDEEKSPRETLTQFAHELYQRFNYRKSFESILPELTPIFNLVSSSKSSHNLIDNFSMHQQIEMQTHQTQKTDLEQATINHSSIVPIEPTPLPTTLQIERNNFTYSLCNYATRCTELFNSPNFTKRLWLSENLTQTASSKSTPLGINYLKPALYMLLVAEKGEMHAIALSDEEAVFFQKQLLTTCKGSKLVALLDSFGAIVQNGRGELSFDPAISNHPFVQDCVTDLGLLQCDLRHPQRLIRRLQDWDDFWPLWKQIKQSQPLLNELQIEPIERLIPKEKRVRLKKNKSKGIFLFL